MERELNDHAFSRPNDFEAQDGDESEAVRSDANDIEGPVQSALSNPLVLHQIFRSLPTIQLLKICSLVNKNWNIQARKFVRDHREYEVNVHSEEAGQICTTCSTLEKLAHSLSGMSVIPINSICYTLERHNCKFSSIENSEHILRIKLKTLTIRMEHFRFRCASLWLFTRMLHENSTELGTLTFNGISPLLPELLSDWVPQLPKLESFIISSPRPYEDLYYKDFYRKIIQNAPNLKTVLTGETPSYTAYRILSDPKYNKLLDRHILAIDSAESERLNLQVAEASPTPRTLHLVYHRSDWKFYKSFCTVLEQLLHSSKESLEVIDLTSEDNIEKTFMSFYWPTLTKVKQLHFFAVGNSRALLRAITTCVDYGRTFPALRSVRLGLVSTISLTDGPVEDDDVEEENSEEEDCVHRGFVCKTVSKLEVDLSMGTVSFSQLKATFPSTVHLVLVRMSPSNAPSFWQIFRLWPQLEQLELQGLGRGLCPNHDAEFCGISRDEMKRYYGKDDEFLRALHIVPIRPCISTLPNLRHLLT